MLSIFPIACNRLNQNPPDYVKDVTVYKEGSEGLMIYFVLADADGVMTTADGGVTLTISETHTEYSSWDYKEIRHDVILYSTSYNVQKSDFKKTTVGLGAFQHEVILCPVGRVTYSSFEIRPTQFTGKAVIEFKTHSGQVLRGEESIFF
jgi:DNA-directed RNA polymerase alpha subunit